MENKKETLPPKPKVCLVTGGAGFIGSHLCDKLVRLGFSIYIVDNLSQGKADNIEHLMLQKKFRFFHFDITSEEFFTWVHKLKVDYVFHLASPVGVSVVMNTEAQLFKRHLNASKRLFDWALRQGASLFFASSSEIYGNPLTTQALTETQAKDPSWFLENGDRYRYGLLKRELEIFLQEFDLKSIPTSRKKDTLDEIKKTPTITIGRFFNIFGPRQNPDIGMVIPRFIHAAIANKPITIYGSGTEVRSFCPVSIAVKSIIELVIDSDEPFRLVNIGSTEQIQIIELAHLIKKQASSLSTIVYINSEKESGRNEAIHSRIPDISYLKKISETTQQEDWIEYLQNWIHSERIETQRTVKTGVSLGYN